MLFCRPCFWLVMICAVTVCECSAADGPSAVPREQKPDPAPANPAIDHDRKPAGSDPIQFVDDFRTGHPGPSTTFVDP